METIKFDAQKREKSTKGSLNKLRKSGKVPAICYNKDQNILLSVDSAAFEKLFDKVAKHIIIDLNIENNSKKVLVKDYAVDPILKNIIHIDFFEITDSKSVRVKVPIRLTSLSKGVKKGGVLQHSLHTLSIECLPKDIPESIILDINNLDIGDTTRAESVQLGDNIRILTSKRQAIVSVIASRVSKMDEQAEEIVSTEQTKEESK